MRLRLCTDQDGPARVIVKGSHCVSAETIRRHYRNIQSFPLLGVSLRQGDLVRAVTPARGPRPTLKGEEPLTLRLMDDVAVPTQLETTGWRTLGRPSSQTLPGPNDTLPNHYIPSQAPAAARSAPANRPRGRAVNTNRWSSLSSESSLLAAALENTTRLAHLLFL